MKYIPPEKQIDIGNEGFSGNDRLNRSKTGEKLSLLLEKTTDPLVVALDGEWGSGKSFFLKCWVGAHNKEFNHESRVVYIDAFETDYFEDPLLALSEAITSQLDIKDTTALSKIKGTALALGKPALKAGLSMLTFGATEVAGEVIDAGLGSLSADLANKIDDAWKKETSKRKMVEEFKSSLQKLTEGADQSAPRKLIIVVDELDRCRPDYALSVLEISKHFFNVDNVHFVLGTNLKELENSVRARYGAMIDATNYLQKFFTISLRLNNNLDQRYSNKTAARHYFEATASEMGINESVINSFEDYFDMFPQTSPISLRHAQRLLTQISLLPISRRMFEEQFGRAYLITGLTILKHSAPDLYRKAAKGAIDREDIDKFFGFKDQQFDRSDRRSTIANIWYQCTGDFEPYTKDINPNSSLWGFAIGCRREEEIPSAICNYIELFRITDGA